MGIRPKVSGLSNSMGEGLSTEPINPSPVSTPVDQRAQRLRPYS
jgi:hypothetical protein